MSLGMVASAAAGPAISIYIEELTRSSCKNFLRACQKKFHTSTKAKGLQDLTYMQGPLKEDINRIPARSSHKDLFQIMHQDLFKSFSQGPAQDHAKASGSISQGSPQDLQTKCIKERAPKRILQPSCASPRDRNAHGMSSFTREFTGKKLRPRSATTALCETAQLKCT